MKQHIEIWNHFCEHHNVQKTLVPLFNTLPNGNVLTKRIGNAKVRNVLCRDDSMEEVVRRECAKLISDWHERAFIYDGLLYIMAVKEGDGVAPLYIGKAETIGKRNGNLSANIKGIEHDTSKFARWGDGYEYHIGDLSAAVLPGHDQIHIERKYQMWAAALFKNYPSETPTLRRPVYFWAKAWSRSDLGPWEDFGPTRLTFLEYLLIGLASSAFPGLLLNREGHNRK